MEDVRGRFVWHQLMTRDVPGAKKFYSKLVGWKTMPWPLDPAYTVCHAELGPVAGIMEIPAEFPSDVPSHWVQYIGTRDVDATADAAVRAGGSVMKAPSDMQGAGRYAVLKDPQGALFAIIAPENARPEGAGPPELGTFSWHELATTDNEAAFAFYSGLFGWDAIQRMDMGPSGAYLIFGQNGVQRGGMYIPSTAQMPPSWTPYAHVPDADEAHALATTLGSTPLFGPMEVPGGSRVGGLVDPAGAVFAIHSMPAVTAAATPAAEPTPRARAKPKARPARKPAAKKKVVKKAAPARRVARKAAAKKVAPKKKAPARKAKAKAKVKVKAKVRPKMKQRAKARKKSGARRKK